MRSAIFSVWHVSCLSPWVAEAVVCICIIALTVQRWSDTFIFMDQCDLGIHCFHWTFHLGPYLLSRPEIQGGLVVRQTDHSKTISLPTEYGVNFFCSFLDGMSNVFLLNFIQLIELLLKLLSMQGIYLLVNGQTMPQAFVKYRKNQSRNYVNNPQSS